MKEGYKKTELGLLPNEWNINTLGQISSGKGEYGIGASATDYVEGEPRYLRITDIGESSNLLYDDIKGLDDESWREYLLEDGDVVFARTGNTTGKSYVYDTKDGKLVYAGFLIKFKINKNVADKKYIKYIIQSKRYWDWIKVMSTRSGQPGINSNEYSTFKIQIPPIKEQEKIADILSTVDSQIDDTDKLIEKTKVLKKGLMQRLLTKGIGHTQFKKTEVGDIPVEWEVKLLQDLYVENIRDFGSFSTTKLIEYVDSGVPYLRSENFKGNKMLIESISYITKEVDLLLDKSYVNKGNILFTKIGNIGSAYLYNGELGEKCNSNATIAKIKVDDEIYSPKYIVYYLISSQCKKQYIGSIVSTPPRVNMGEINKLKIAIPSLEEQKRIANILSKVDSQIEGHENRKKKLEELKKGLMQQLLTGKIRVI